MNNVDEVLGKTITRLLLDQNDRLNCTFSDGVTLILRDAAKYCCETRYMHTEDNLNDYVGARLLGVEIKEVDPVADEWDENTEYGVHDVQFLEIQTSAGALTMVTHNEHNGYYGGFDVVAEVVEEEERKGINDGSDTSNKP